MKKLIFSSMLIGDILSCYVAVNKEFLIKILLSKPAALADIRLFKESCDLIKLDGNINIKIRLLASCLDLLK